jgi:Flp pilus assembly protein TadD
MNKWKLLYVLAAVMTTGCAELGNMNMRIAPRTEPVLNTCRALSPDQELLANLAQEMVAEGRLHAALANLQQLPDNVPEIQLRKARILRVIDADQAWLLYTGLISTPCYTAAANHGLGQILAAAGHYSEAAGHLRLAAREEPANADIRNDLGLVYLHLRRFSESRFELMTALELAEGDSKPAENLLTLLIYLDQWDRARDLIAGTSLSQQQFQAAEARARRMQQEDLAASY